MRGTIGAVFHLNKTHFLFAQGFLPNSLPKRGIAFVGRQGSGAEFVVEMAFGKIDIKGIIAEHRHRLSFLGAFGGFAVVFKLQAFRHPRLLVGVFVLLKHFEEVVFN